ncbi:MAG: hypothetical protein NDI62_00120 [Burkholderiales bacterium]|nr:hypothetical protein [Burkholderiales bacterium]
MLPRDREKLNRLEELKNKLFNKDYQVKIEHRDSFPHFKQQEIRDSWEKKEEINDEVKDNFYMKTSMFKKFFIFSIVFFVLALGYAAYTFFANSNSVSNDNIDISILSNAFTAGGEEYPLLLEIVNRNNSALDLVDLVIEYPKSSRSTLSNDNEHLRISLGTIPAGGIKNENVKLVLFGEQGSILPIKASLEYRVEGSNAIFVKDKTYEVSISSTPINLSISAPNEMSSNQDITLDVKAVLNSTKPVSRMLLKVDYPIGFQFVKSNPSPSLGDNIWNLGDLAAGAERNISIVGKMVDVFDGEEKVFRAWTGSQLEGDKSAIGTVFNSLEHIVAIKKSSVEANLLINGVSQREYAVDTKTAIQGQIQWKNNLETKITDLQIRAKISGNAVNRKTIKSEQGFYDSSQDVIIWDKNSLNKFVEVEPGESGSLGFLFSPLSLFSSLNGMISSPSIKIDISVTGRQEGAGGVSTALTAGESKEIKIISDVGLLTKALYYSGPFANMGSIPPKVEQKTTYTVVWSLSNTANNISKAQIRATLPSWVRFTNRFSPASEDLTYDATNKEVVWNIGNLQRGAGINGTDKQIFFQIELSPSLSQVGTMPILINDAILTGHDDFANVDVRVNKASLNTRLLNDPAFPVSGSRVVE